MTRPQLPRLSDEEREALEDDYSVMPGVPRGRRKGGKAGNKKRVNITIRAADAAVFQRLGAGNLSRGIEIAAQRLKKKPAPDKPTP